jgi:DNA-binding response OmpR family regulator
MTDRSRAPVDPSSLHENDRRIGPRPAVLHADGASRLERVRTSVDDLTVARILVVDDDPDILALVRIKLESCGHDVLTAPDGEAGLAATAEQPDLVLADWTMPRLTGIEMLEQMRADPATAAIPFILLTARANEVHEPGIDGFLAKPFSLADLVAGVDAALARGRSGA